MTSQFGNRARLSNEATWYYRSLSTQYRPPDESISSPELAAGDSNPHTDENTPIGVPQASISPSDGNGETTTNALEAARTEKGRKKELRGLSTTFGHIPGIPVFASWDTRIACSNTAVHRSIMKGICGNKYDGAYSIVLSGMYIDDEDGGETIIYTGSGGRSRWSDSIPPKRLRVGPQIYNQSWDDPSNKALVVSQETGHPVRVVRGSGSLSKYAPVEGYRYDGLYTVYKHWTSKGVNGLDICRYRLERLPDQPPIPVRPI
ncbi:hypothetical protein BS17DRAFT_834381, partial [Gyrodon lividus]